MLALLRALAVGLVTACGSGSWDGGIHARMGWSEEQGLRVIDVPAGPAREAGLAVDDRIVAIDGVSVGDLPRDEVVSRLRGPVGSTVELTVERNGEEIAVELSRAPYAGE